MFRAIVFAVLECGFYPRCAKEIIDSGQIRVQKIQSLIEQSKYGIHDLSYLKLDPHSGLPRLNMSFELGLFLGAKHFGDASQKRKTCLILDSERFRLQQAMSDISGQDVEAHGGQPSGAMQGVRNWLQAASRRRSLPGGQELSRRYRQYEAALPGICAELKLAPHELTFNDMWETITEWQKITAEDE